MNENHDEERAFDGLRPRKFDNFIGQEPILKNLLIHMSAARSRGEALEHLLFYGPPGLGKTTLANIIANEMGVSIKVTSGPAIERPGDLAAILTNLKQHDILFIDEIHRLNKVVEEVLYPAMEDFGLDIIIGKGPSARSIRLDLPRFTLIGATTRIGLLSAPLRDRFGIVNRLEYYTHPELQQVVSRAAEALVIKIDPQGALEIAKRSRGTPRIAIRFLRRVRDYAQVKGSGDISLAIAKECLDSMGVDEFGLDKIDRKYLITVIDKFGGGPVGVETLSAGISEEVETLEDVYEPYLMQLGFIERTPRGRLVTALAAEHVGRKLKGDKTPPQEKLF
ncbi:MAG: Holliday junction branch migration DNA helicase RuvB [Candidatus Margulisbacteria bacterium]|jgi:Holliday junction DNA helicase RuvB|nr:Holliday junction branch migration DNA helicase RuvB [Candidatus Margulisiibacteriota bacterium]